MRANTRFARTGDPCDRPYLLPKDAEGFVDIDEVDDSFELVAVIVQDGVFFSTLCPRAWHNSGISFIHKF
ncbi:MAG TPA: hypothetical protein DDW49_09705 [Deltaproteobacteria bacterium]|nr:MAG: hypothetical protein A2048_00615 [Deltaproteobacteria bacterium GWA2_45_12]HBF13637.1 hypothetical protein [Deltaproteobacteria bacterium]